MRLHMVLPLLVSTMLSSCGTYVPRVEEIWEGPNGEGKTLERKIKTQIFCELQDAIYRINVKEKGAFIKVGDKMVPPVPESWGVQVTITLTILEDTVLSPLESLTTPLKPVVTHPSGIAVSTPQSFSLNLGGGVSADATRIDKFTFFYLVKDLETDTGQCKMQSPEQPNGRTTDDLHGSSFLLESDLGIYQWLNNAVDVRNDIGIPSPSQQEVLSYDVKFQVVSSFSATPSWKLVHYTTGSSGNLFSTKRDRTHDLLISFGPVQQQSKDEKKNKTPLQPGTLAATDALILQLQSAINTGARLAPSNQ